MNNPQKLIVSLGQTLLAILFVGSVSMAIASPELAQKNACSGCHAAATTVYGPSYQDIAKRYANDKANGVNIIVKSLKQGSTGKWGKDAMPALPSLSDSDAQVLAAWIMSGAK